MARSHDRAAARERQAAKAFGTERVTYRDRYVAAPDTLPVRLPSGEVLQQEVKTFGRGLARVRAALAQARRYAPSAVPVAVCSETGGEAIACLPLKDLARLLGLQQHVGPQQLCLLGK